MVLVDTSVWVDYFRAVASPEAEHLAGLIEREEDVCTCGLVVTEVLQGIRADAEYRRVARLLEHLVYLPAPPSAYIEAAALYRRARKKGLTIRRSFDCVIAAVALSHRVPVLQRDRDFDAIAGVSRLEVVRPEC